MSKIPLSFPSLLLGLMVSPVAAQPVWAISGRLWVDSFNQLYQHTSDGESADDTARPSDTLDVNRVNMDLTYSPLERWDFMVRVGFNHSNAPTVRDDQAHPPFSQSDLKFEQLYGRYHHDWVGALRSGYIPVPQISATSESPAVFGVDPNLYHVIAYAGNRPGVSWEAHFDSCVLKAGLWQQTENQALASFTVPSLGVADFETFASTDFLDNFLLVDDYHNRAFKLGVNAALHYYPVDTPSAAVAFNIGWQSRPLETPIVFGVMAQAGDNSTAKYTFSAFNAVSESSLSLVSYWGRVVFEAQGQYQVLGLAHDLQYGTVSADEARFRDLFMNDGYAIGYSALLGYHFAGGCYKLQRSTGQLERQGSGWDVGVSYGGVVQKNPSALRSTLGLQDYTNTSFGTIGSDDYATGVGRVLVTDGPQLPQEDRHYTYVAVDSSYPRAAQSEDTTDGFNSLEDNGGDPPRAYQIRTQSYTFYVNYAYNENLVVQFELQNAQHQQEIFGDSFDSLGYSDAPLSASYQYLRTRLNVTF